MNDALEAVARETNRTWICYLDLRLYVCYVVPVDDAFVAFREVDRPFDFGIGCPCTMNFE